MKKYQALRISIRTAAICGAGLLATLGTGTATAATCPVDPATLIDCPIVSADTTLTQNCKGPMNIIHENVIVNLGGYAVMCSNDDGIVIQNQDNVKVMNGSVSHNQREGIQVSESANIRLLNLDLIDNADVGLDVVNSEQLVVKYVTATDNFLGLSFTNTDRWKLAHSKANYNTWLGVNIDQGVETVVQKSKINLNGNDGIASTGRNNKFRHLIANKNGDDGIDINAPSLNVLIQYNKTNKNLDDGIDIDQGTAVIYVFDNLARLNSDTDLTDNNANCTSNSWLRNIFEKSNESCIQ